MLAVGDSAPEFVADADGGASITLSDLRGKKVILYFYPRDNTPGCTAEACSFRDAGRQIDARNAVVVGVSPDSVKSHDRFKAKHDLTFTLISDGDHSLAKAFGVWREKKMYGRTYMGIVRSTFVIDERGTIEAVYDKVRVRGHVARVLADL